jgi:hypothetical protein
MTQAERDILDLVLSIDFAGVAQLRQQISSALVTGKCDCGCPSIELTVPADAPVANVPHRLAPVDGVVAPIRDAWPGASHASTANRSDRRVRLVVGFQYLYQSVRLV